MQFWSGFERFSITTRLISIESQSKIIVLFVVVVTVIIVGHRNLTLKFGQIRVSNCGDIAVVVVKLQVLVVYYLTASS